MMVVPGSIPKMIFSLSNIVFFQLQQSKLFNFGLQDKAKECPLYLFHC